MPTFTGKAPLGLAGSFVKHARDATERPEDFGRLTGFDIRGGVARLIDAHLGEYKGGSKARPEGGKFIYLAGQIVEPEVALKTLKVWDSDAQPPRSKVLSSREERCYGLRTSQTVPLCRTRKANGEHVEEEANISSALNLLRLLGGEDCTACLEGVRSDAEALTALEGLLNTLVGVGPYFRFSVRSGEPSAEYPEPRSFETWLGAQGLEDYVPATPQKVVERGQPAAGWHRSAPPTAQAGPSAADKHGDEGVTGAVLYGGVEDLSELLEAANACSANGASLNPAGDRLAELAISAGATEEEIEQAPNWEAVCDLARGQERGLTDEGDATFTEETALAAGAGPEDHRGPDPADPQVGDLFYYQCLDAKTRRPLLDAKTRTPQRKLDVLVEAVNRKAKTVTLQDVASQKTLTGPDRKPLLVKYPSELHTEP